MLLFRFILFVTMMCMLSLNGNSRQVLEKRRYRISDSIHLQGVAVDASFFYVISNTAVYKYRKGDGQMVKFFDGKKEGILKHLNAGIVRKGKLYCAHSNFPGSPMVSSIEIFDTKDMRHVGSHSFGIWGGSATWIDQKDGYWWVAFANYSGRYSSEGRDNRWTQLVKFNRKWEKVSSWVYPEKVLELFAPFSNSGGAWGRNNELYVTGHDRSEVYVLRIPEFGFTLQYLRTLSVMNKGQGFAVDRFEKEADVIYTVSREDHAVIVEQLE